MFAGILAKVAFSAFGRKITVGLILKIIAGLIIAALLWWAVSAVRNHFQHITDLETQVTTLTTDNTKLKGQKAELIALNRSNAATTQVVGEQKAAATVIADTEVKASTVRTTKTKERADVILDTPPTADPVAPVVRDTLDSLWR
mgnify:CR=1 FL=1